MFYREKASLTMGAFDTIKDKLCEKGFKKASMSEFFKMALKYKRHSELGADFCSVSIMNRGLESRKSNFFVFIGTKRNLLGKETLKVLYYNPSPPSVRYNLRSENAPEPQGRKETIILKEYCGDGSPDDFVSNTVADIMELSSAKPEDRYYYWPHNHVGYLSYNGNVHRLIDMKSGVIPGISGPADDGKSNPFDIVLSAALFNGDFFAITSHNSFSTAVFNELDSFGKSLGLPIVPGIEFTMPICSYNPEDMVMLISNINERLEERGLPPLELKEKLFRYSQNDLNNIISSYTGKFGKMDFDIPQITVNGPHIVAMFDDPELAHNVNSLILLRDKKDAKYPPLSVPGVELLATMELLKRNYKDRIFLMVAHPFCDLSLPHVGIGSRMEIGGFAWLEASRLFSSGLADGVAAYNPSVKSELHEFKMIDSSIINKYQKKYRPLLGAWIAEMNSLIQDSLKNITEISMKKWGFPILDANALNSAYARWLAHNDATGAESIIRMGEPDTHFYGPFSFDDVHMNHLGRTNSYIEGYGIEKTAKSFLEALFRAKRHQGVDANYYAYAQMDRSSNCFVFDKARVPTDNETMEEQRKYLTNYGIGIIKVFLPDIVKRAFLKTGLPISKLPYIVRKFMKE